MPVHRRADRSAAVPPRRRRWLRVARQGAVATTVLLLALEVVLRLLGYGSFILYRPDEELLWLPAPGQRGRTVEGRLPITINRAGFRSREEPPRRDPGEMRVFAFGDSVTMGWGVDDDSHYAAVLERLLGGVAPDGRRARVISAGVNAYPTSLCVRRLERVLADGWQVDAAVLAYSFNHSHEGLARLAGEEKRAFLRKVALKGMLRRSALYNFAVEDLLRGAVYYRIRDRLVAGSWNLEEVKARGEEEEELAHFYADLGRARNTARRHGFALVFLLLGSREQRDRLDPYQAGLARFAAREDIPLVDMVAALADEDHAPLFLDHPHPSPAGHERIARELLAVMEERGLAGAGVRRAARGTDRAGGPSGGR